MKETARLWSQDYSEVLFTTEDREAAKQWFLTSGYDWLPIVIDYGTAWQQRWSGRIEVTDGQIEINQDFQYLKHMIVPPSLDLT